jgi:hypothetical protein
MRIRYHKWQIIATLFEHRDGDLDVFCGLHHEDLQHVREQRQPVRQGVFSAPGGAGVDPDLQPDVMNNTK